ncbi:unnamed protein product [Nesidiocoris tenuis]|uniref:Cytosol aminopeptidase domain-containing protein n=1 Tax=Nesidiocoris tenuis TaxID=355587 RepID=A0A6H5HRJ0_9HEMI|nr:unnamed protein product [Nesidiocoris tenuis]
MSRKHQISSRLRSNRVTGSGKNATFCAGGLNLRKSDAMSVERADVASAAVTIATFKAIAQMRLPINIVAMMALYEHMPSGMALKPGDVLMARNGKTILMEDVALSGRIVAADILTFLEAFQPCLVIHKATSNTSAAPAVGYPATGVWSTSDILWEEINRAGMVTGDRFWRFPIWKYFRTQIKGVRAEMRGFGPHGSDGYRQNGQRSDHALPEKGPNDRTPYAAADSVSLPGRLSARSSQCLLLSIEQINGKKAVSFFGMSLIRFRRRKTKSNFTVMESN